MIRAKLRGSILKVEVNVVQVQSRPRWGAVLHMTLEGSSGCKLRLVWVARVRRSRIETCVRQVKITPVSL
jgi:hypothetical protein